jgi:Ran-binding protein 9/10
MVSLGIRTAVLTGDMDRAIKLTRAFYPQVLESNENIYFKLKCRKFVEMIRAMTEAAQPSHSRSDPATNGTNNKNSIHNGSGVSTHPQNGHSHAYPPIFSSDSDDEAMEDVDDGEDSIAGSLSPSVGGPPSEGAPKSELELLQEALVFGQELRTEWSKDPRREVQRALEDTLALIAYTNPAESPLKGMLGREGREAIAEELGSCILGECMSSTGVPCFLAARFGFLRS